MSAQTSDALAFGRLCREGMLFEVQAWISAGRPVPAGRTVKDSPLVLAAGKGFHSLLVLLLGQGLGQSQDRLDAALAVAGKGGHAETCRLLLAHGAGLGTVQAAEVVEGGNPEAIGLLVEAGLDLETGDPLARALVNRSAAALLFFRLWRRRRKIVRRQGAMALKYLVKEDKQWEVTRLSRAGADARLAVPDLVLWGKRKDRYEISALQLAASSASFPILMRMRIRKSDDIPDLIRWAFIGLQ